MTDRLKRLQALYEGGLDDESSDDTHLRKEMGDLRAMKGLLDARPKRRPRPSTVAAVLAAACSDVEDESMEVAVADPDESVDVRRGPRTDRPSRERRRAVVLRIGATSALVAVLLAVVGILQLNVLDPTVNPSHSDAESQAANENAAQTPEYPTAANEPAAAPASRVGEADSRGTDASESAAGGSGGRESDDREPEVPESAAPLAEAATTYARSAPPQAPSGLRIERQESGRSAANSAQFNGEVSEVDVARYSDVLSWEQQSDVLEVSQHIDLVGGDIEMEWGAPAVPLEMIPENRARDPFLQRAGERRTP